MTPSSISAYPHSPVIAPPAGFSLWTPGLRLVRHLNLRHKAWLMMLCPWCPALLLIAALWSGSAGIVALSPALDPLYGLLDQRLGTRLGPHWTPLALLCIALAASLYLSICAAKALAEGMELLGRTARDVAAGRPLPHETAVGTDELAQALAALGAAGEQMQRSRDAASRNAEIAARSARELADVQVALQLESRQVSAATGEIARRTIALCGMLDSNVQDLAQVGAELDAIHDEEEHTLQLMVALRARLLALAHSCQALGESTQACAGLHEGGAGAAVGGLRDAAGAEIAQCHQLSERVGGAERLNQRRIESMRRVTDRLQGRAERGMREAHQLMVLTRQIEASQAVTRQRLEHIAASCAALEAPAAAQGAKPRADEAAAR